MSYDKFVKQGLLTKEEAELMEKAEAMQDYYNEMRDREKDEEELLEV